MKSKIALMLCIGTLAVSTIGCADHTEKTKNFANSTETETISTVILSETVTAEESEEKEYYSLEDYSLEEDTNPSWNKFRDVTSAYYKMSEKDARAMYQRIEDSKILAEENQRLTGAVLNDYDGNGQTDMVVCLYDEKENSDPYTDDYTNGCLYLFMNDDAPYYIYDAHCCYRFGHFFGDFGADIDHDGNTEIVFCVQGTGVGATGDCQKFVIKYKKNAIERMELPSGFSEDEERDYDSGFDIAIEKDTESGAYNVYCPSFEETIVLSAGEEMDWISGANSRGYYALEMIEYEGEQHLAGYEYLYAGSVVNGFASAVFVFDWDENGKAYVYDWYVEDWDEGKIYVPYDRIQKGALDSKTLFGKEETGEEVEAYKEFLTGKRASGIAEHIYTFIAELLKQKNGLLLEDMLARIFDETRSDSGVDDVDIGSVQYALIDCGGDGRRQLALRVGELDDESYLTMVFDYKDGKISMIYAVDTWTRNFSDYLYQNGYVYSYGIAGGALCYVGEGMIGADGIYRKSYDCNVGMGHGLYGMSSFWEVWEAGKLFPVEFYKYTINDETIYAYNILDDIKITDEEMQIILDYIKDNEKQLGTSFLTYDKAWELVEKNRESLNITDKMNEEQNQINWKTLSVRPSVPQR